MSQKNDSEIVLNQKAVQILLVVILCLMSLQPLVGITTTFWGARSAEELNAMITNFFLMKSELIRYNGYVALLVAIFVAIFTERVSIIQFFQKLYRKKPWNICFTLLLIWVCVNVFTVSPLLDISLNGDAYRFEGLFSIIAYAGFFAAASLVRDDKLKKIWMNVTISASTVLGIGAVHSLYSENPIVLTYMNRQIVGISSAGGLMATFPQYNHYSYYICVVLVMTAGLMLKETNKRNRIVYMMLLAFHQYLLALNGTRGSMIAALLAIGFLSVIALIRKDASKKQVAVMWGLLIVGSLPAMSTILKRLDYTADEINFIVKDNVSDTDLPSSRRRLLLWKNCVELIKMRPIQGFGLNMASYALRQFKGLIDMPHNEYLQHFVDLGLIGFSLYVGALVSLFVSAIRKIKELPYIILVVGCGVIAYAISAFFGVTIVEVVPFFYILLGFVKWEKPVEEVK